jgi:hypothetical protein
MNSKFETSFWPALESVVMLSRQCKSGSMPFNRTTTDNDFPDLIVVVGSRRDRKRRVKTPDNIVFTFKHFKVSDTPTLWMMIRTPSPQICIDR